MATDLKRLARAVGRDAKAAEQAYLAGMLDLPATARAAAGWWRGHRAALAALAEERPEIRRRLLDLIPEEAEDGLHVLWLEILEECGAAAVLCDPEGFPEEARPRDGSVGWLRRYGALCEKRHLKGAPAELHPLVERMADRLKAELAERGGRRCPRPTRSPCWTCCSPSACRSPIRRPATS